MDLILFILLVNHYSFLFLNLSFSPNSSKFFINPISPSDIALLTFYSLSHALIKQSFMLNSRAVFRLLYNSPIIFLTSVFLNPFDSSSNHFLVPVCNSIFYFFKISYLFYILHLKITISGLLGGSVHFYLIHNSLFSCLFGHLWL